VSDPSELTPEDVKEILRLVDEAGLEALELETPRFTVRFRRGTTGDDEPVVETKAPPPRAEANGLLEVTAPMVGTFYRAPAPGEPPFVQVGGTVDEDTVVCILEVMKLMTAVTAGVRGTIAEVCVDDATPVQYGDPLFRVQQP
jgi:acetyl-CoA carboxylase biotin carboxyl carrier protein